MSQADQKLIGRLFADKHFHMYIPGLAHVLGSAKAALLVSYLLYWRGKGAKIDYTYKTVPDMHTETGLTKNEQKSAIDICVAAGFLKVVHKGIPRKRHFNLSVDQLEKHITSHPETARLAQEYHDRSNYKNSTTITESNIEISNNTSLVYERFLEAFSLTRQECGLTSRRRHMISERLEDLGLHRLLRAIEAASSNPYYNGQDDGRRKVTIESMFKEYENAENFSNMAIND